MNNHILMNTKFWRLGIFLLLLPMWASATHIVGGDIGYRCLGDNCYEVVLTIYRDCVNGDPKAVFDDPAFIGVFGKTDGKLIKVINLPVPERIDTLSLPENFCPSDNDPDICIETVTYRDTFTVPMRRGGYDLAYQRCCRNRLIQNIQTPLEVGATYKVWLSEEAMKTCNSSPVIGDYPPVTVCVEQEFVFDLAAEDNAFALHKDTDPDQVDQTPDSLVYRLCTPIQGADADFPRPYPNDFTPFVPVNWSGGPFGYNLSNVLGNVVFPDRKLAIDPNTGALIGFPERLGTFLIGICIEEYDSETGQLISETLRDFEVTVVPCTGKLVELTESLETCLGDTLFLNPQGDTLATGDTFTWIPESLVSDPASINPSFTGISDTTLTLRIQSADSCTVTEKTVQISVRAGPELQPIVFTPNCDGIGGTIENPNTGLDSFFIFFDGQPLPVTENGEGSLYMPTPFAGCDSITLIGFLNGCESRLRQEVCQLPGILQADFQAEVSGCPGDTVVLSLTDRSINETSFEITAWRWLVNGEERASGPSADLRVLYQDTLVVELEIITSAPCSSRISQPVVLPAEECLPLKNFNLCPGESIAIFLDDECGYTWEDRPGLDLSTPGIVRFSPLLTTAYPVQITQGGVCVFQDSVMVTVEAPVELVVEGETDALCAPKLVELTATTSIDSVELFWYATPALDSLIGTGPQIEVMPNFGDNIFFAIARAIGEDCRDTTSFSITVGDQELNTQISGPEVLCGASDTSLLATAALANTTFRWYSDANFQNLAGENALLPIQPVLGENTFFLIASNPLECVQPDTLSFNFEVFEQPTISITSKGGQDCCAEEPFRLVANTDVPNTEFIWSLTPDFSDTLAIGPTFVVAPDAPPDTYYLLGTVGRDCSADTSFVYQPDTAAITSLEVDILGPDTLNIDCCDADSIDLEARANLTCVEYYWFAESDLIDTLARGSSFRFSPEVSPSTFYLLGVSDGGCRDTAIYEFNIDSVNTGEDLRVDILGPDTLNIDCCDADSIDLEARANLTCVEYYWFAESDLIDTLARGSSFRFSPEVSPSTFYLLGVSDGGCRDTAIYEFNIDSVNTGEDLRVDILGPDTLNIDCCDADSIDLEARANLTCVEYYWFAESDLIDTLARGSSFRFSPEVSPSTFYLLGVSDGGCRDTAIYEFNIDSVSFTEELTVTIEDPLDITIGCCDASPINLVALANLDCVDFFWFNSLNLVDTLATGADFAFTPESGQDTVYVLGVSLQGCLDTTAYAFNVDSFTVLEDLSIEIETPEELTIGCCESDSIPLSATANLSCVEYLWFDDVSFIDPLASGPEYAFVPDVNRDTVYVLGISTFGCRDTATFIFDIDSALVAELLAVEIEAPEEITIGCCAADSVELIATANFECVDYAWFGDATFADTLSASDRFRFAPDIDQDTFYVIGTSTLGCRDTATYIFRLDSALVIEELVVEIDVPEDIIIDCCEAEDIEISGTANLNCVEYFWFSDATLSDTLAAGPDFSFNPQIGQDTFYLLGVSILGCLDTAVFEFRIDDYPLAENLEASVDGPVDVIIDCCGPSELIDLQANANLACVTFAWFADATLTDTLAVGEKYSLEPSGASDTIYLQAVSDNGCTDIALYTYDSQFEPIEAMIDGPTDVVLACCDNDPVQLLGMSNIDCVTYIWFGDEGLTDTLGTGDELLVIPEDLQSDYFLQVVSENGCTAVAQQTLVIATDDNLEVSIDAPNQIPMGDTEISLFANSNLPCTEYFWFADQALTDTLGSGATIVVKLGAMEEREIYLQGFTANGCVAEANVSLLRDCSEPFVPNAFTPNGDNINDVLYVRGENIEVVRFQILNRWGNVVYDICNDPKCDDSCSMTCGWDGTFRNEGNRLPPDVYGYVLEARCTVGDQEVFVINGNVTLFR